MIYDADQIIWWDRTAGCFRLHTEHHTSWCYKVSAHSEARMSHYTWTQCWRQSPVRSCESCSVVFRSQKKAWLAGYGNTWIICVACPAEYVHERLLLTEPANLIRNKIITIIMIITLWLLLEVIRGDAQKNVSTILQLFFHNVMLREKISCNYTFWPLQELALFTRACSAVSAIGG